MNEAGSTPKKDNDEIESLKKTTRISLEEALTAQPTLKKATGPQQTGDKKATAPITGIPTHTVPIPQTIRLKRPSTSPIVINPPDITSAPTVVKAIHAKIPEHAGEELATVIKQPVAPRPLKETSRIILEISPQTPTVRRKTGPVTAVSQTEATPAPKTIRLKRPSSIVGADHPTMPQSVPTNVQMAKKSETAKIELPKETESQTTSATQRKTIKIKRTDRNILPRTVVVSRQPELQPQVEKVVPQKDLPALPSLKEENLAAFSILAMLAVVCLAMLAYLLTAQAFGPSLLLPIPASLF